MDPTVQSTIITAIATLLGVALGALSMHLLARSQHKMELERFYSQRWWDKKEEAYSHIIEQLSHLQYYYGEWLDTLERGGDSDRLQGRLAEDYRQANEQVEKAAVAGGYIISGEAAAALDELSHALARVYLPDDMYGEFGERYSLVKQCIARVRECAGVDLAGRQSHT